MDYKKTVILLVVVLLVSGCVRKRQPPVRTTNTTISHHQVIQPSNGDPGARTGEKEVTKTVPKTTPVHIPDPTPLHTPDPTSILVPDAKPTPVQGPTPVFVPESTAEPVQDSTPVVITELTPVFVPESTPVYEPEYEPEYESDSTPVFIPDPVEENVIGEEKQDSVISLAYVEKRLVAYNRKLSRWKEYDSKSSTLNLDRQATEQMVECFLRLQRLLNGYNRLRAIITAGQTTLPVPVMSPGETQQLQEEDVNFLESFCGRLLDGEKGVEAFSQSTPAKDPTQIEEAIKASYANREYEQVAQHWLEIPEEQMGSISLATKLLYGKSLMFLHQEQRAASVYEQIISEIGRKEKETTDVLELYKTLSNLYIAARNYSAASKQYRKIVLKYKEVLEAKEWSEFQQSILRSSKMGGRELGEYSAIIRNYMGYIPSQDGYKPVRQAERFLENYPESLMNTNVDRIRSELFLKAESWFKTLIGEIETLQLNEQYEDGLLLVETIPLDIIGEDQAQLVEKKKAELQSAEEAVREQLRVEKMQELTTSWDYMSALVDSAKYDDALVQLRSMLNTELSDKVKDKIGEVSLLAAKEKRQQAAKLFIRAMNAKEEEVKKQNLLESHNLLVLITLKYPKVRIVEKVKANIRRVEKEMNLLDPSLVEWSKEATRRQLEQEKHQQQMQTTGETGLQETAQPQVVPTANMSGEPKNSWIPSGPLSAE